MSQLMLGVSPPGLTADRIFLQAKVGSCGALQHAGPALAFLSGGAWLSFWMVVSVLLPLNNSGGCRCLWQEAA